MNNSNLSTLSIETNITDGIYFFLTNLVDYLPYEILCLFGIIIGIFGKFTSF